MPFTAIESDNADSSPLVLLLLTNINEKLGIAKQSHIKSERKASEEKVQRRGLEKAERGNIEGR